MRNLNNDAGKLKSLIPREIDLPDDVIGEHFLGLFLPQTMQIAAGAVIDRVSDDLISSQNSVQPRQQRMVKRRQHFSFEADPPVLAAVAGARDLLLLLDGGSQHCFEREQLAALRLYEEYDAFGAPAERRDHLQILQIQRSRTVAAVDISVVHGRGFQKPAILAEFTQFDCSYLRER